VPTSGGFTRTDLLALLSAIALWTIVFGPALAATVDGSSSATCLHNLRRLTQAWLLFAEDRGGRPPGNQDDGSTAGHNWVGGIASAGAPSFGDSQILIDPRRSQLADYSRDASIYRCPADLLTSRIGGREVAHARSYSMNAAVGTKADGYRPVDGPWLDNTHSHVAGTRWRTFARLSDIMDPAPSNLYVFLGEDPCSINDGTFALGMRESTGMEWIDFPSTLHEFGAGFGFADGRAELHRWTDARTLVTGGNVSRRSVPDSPDLAWMQERTTTLIR